MINNLIKRFKSAPALSCESKSGGSALIMTVVLTVMLAIVAVMFVAVARMDMASTGNIADNKTLESSAKSIIELINRQLVLDTPGAATPSQEYYDYPDSNNAWLASIEPYFYSDNGTPVDTNDDVYNWRQISDVTGYLHGRSFETQDVNVRPSDRTVIKDYPDPDKFLDNSGQLKELLADADGDGIADSKWFELANMRSSKGKPIYAAVRIIDNSGMVNINTAYRFDANSADANKIDGKSQMQVNLNGLLKSPDSIITLHNTRLGGGDNATYEDNVIWRYVPYDNYTPFDISDELELRYRYCIDSRFISRFEVNCPQTAKGAGTANFGNLYDASSNWGIYDWQIRITDPNFPSDTGSDRRHLLTSLNLDRIIDPCGQKMTNINTADVNDIYNNLFTRVGFNSSLSAQIAVNLIDYRDSDSNVTDFMVGTATYYGFERPCIYISELACRIIDANKSYAIELYRPYSEDKDPNGWKLYVDTAFPTTQYDINNWPGTKHFYVIKWENSGAPLTVDYNDAYVLTIPYSGSTAIFATGTKILLTRNGGDNVIADSIGNFTDSNLMTADGNHSLEKDITLHKCIRRLWAPGDSNTPTLGRMNNYVSPDANTIQAYPKNSPFTNIGELGMIFRKGAYYKDGGSNADVIGYNNNVRQEYQVRLNLADPCFQQIFKYLTVIDPNNYIADANETRVKGRININTAPVSVLAQLPWVSLRNNPVGYNDPNLAKAIIAYRDKTSVSSGDPNYSNRPGAAGFQTIGQLCDVCDINSSTIINYGINYYGRDGNDLAGPPDLDPNDGAVDDFEERDLIFARISNLVTVRSDMFTAYILVRIGTDGPQKRCITILDRSRVKDINDRIYIRAFQTTPEAR